MDIYIVCRDNYRVETAEQADKLDELIKVFDDFMAALAIRRFELEEYRLDDLKQIFSAILWQELQNYDSDIPLLQLIKYKVRSVWHEYVRINCGNFQPDTRNQYMILKKIARLYHHKNNGKNKITDIILEIAAEMNLTEKSVESFITAIATFKPKYNADFYERDNEDENYYSAVNSIADNHTTEDWFFRLQRKEKLINALGELSKTDKKADQEQIWHLFELPGDTSEIDNEQYVYGT